MSTRSYNSCVQYVCAGVGLDDMDTNTMRKPFSIIDGRPSLKIVQCRAVICFDTTHLRNPYDSNFTEREDCQRFVSDEGLVF